MEEVLPSELWPEIVKYCSPLTLFFLESVSSKFRAYVANVFPVIKAQYGAPEVTSPAELVYYCSLKTEEKVKYCIEHGWMRTLNLIDCGGWDTSWDLLQRAPIQYKVLYPEMMKCNENRYEDSYKALNEVERALLFVHLTYERYNNFSGYTREKTKIPLPVMRKRIEKQESTSDEVAIYWVFTGGAASQRPAVVDKKKWQICRDFVASDGTSTPPALGNPFYELICFHGNAQLLMKCCSFTYDSIATEIVLARRVLTQDQFFSCMTGGGWDRYFSNRGMESSYRRYTRYRKVRPVFFLRSDNLAASVRNSKREKWPKKLNKDGELYDFFSQKPLPSTL